jgi:hypothetical protein
MFCSFFDLSGNPPRISPTDSMSLALNSGRIMICREYFLGLFMKQGLQPHIALGSTHPGVIRIMVANGYGTAETSRPADSSDEKPIHRHALTGLSASIRRQSLSQSGKFLYPSGKGAWSGRRESNPRMQLGKLPFYH